MTHTLSSLAGFNVILLGPSLPLKHWIKILKILPSVYLSDISLVPHLFHDLTAPIRFSMFYLRPGVHIELSTSGTSLRQQLDRLACWSSDSMVPFVLEGFIPLYYTSLKLEPEASDLPLGVADLQSLKQFPGSKTYPLYRAIYRPTDRWSWPLSAWRAWRTYRGSRLMAVYYCLLQIQLSRSSKFRISHTERRPLGLVLSPASLCWIQPACAPWISLPSVRVASGISSTMRGQWLRSAISTLCLQRSRIPTLRAFTRA